MRSAFLKKILGNLQGQKKVVYSSPLPGDPLSSTRRPRQQPLCIGLEVRHDAGMPQHDIDCREVAGDGKNFVNGRHFSAWIGLVPGQHSTGGKPTLLGISYCPGHSGGVVFYGRVFGFSPADSLPRVDIENL